MDGSKLYNISKEGEHEGLCAIKFYLSSEISCPQLDSNSRHNDLQSGDLTSQPRGPVCDINGISVSQEVNGKPPSHLQAELGFLMCSQNEV